MNLNNYFEKKVDFYFMCYMFLSFQFCSKINYTKNYKWHTNNSQVPILCVQQGNVRLKKSNIYT